MVKDRESGLPIAVIGAGPVGLAVAAQLLTRGNEPILFEAGCRAGANITSWAHVRMFTPWRFSIDRASRYLLLSSGWQQPDLNGYPTGQDFLDEYISPLAQIPEIASTINLNKRVKAIGRAGKGKARSSDRANAPFEIHTIDASGDSRIYLASAVIDASGTWHQPNPIGASGIPVPGEALVAPSIRYGMPDILGEERQRFLGRKILIAGSGHSAIGNLLSCAELIELDQDTKVFWALRSTNLGRVLGGRPDELTQRGALGRRLKSFVDAGHFTILSPLSIHRLYQQDPGGVTMEGLLGSQSIVLNIDEIIASTGARPDLGLLSELQIEMDAVLDCPRSLAGLIDPEVHTCGTVNRHGAFDLLHPEPNFFVVGMKSYGRAPTFLLATGYEQARSVAAWLAGDLDEARRIDDRLLRDEDPPEPSVNPSNRLSETLDSSAPAA